MDAATAEIVGNNIQKMKAAKAPDEKIRAYVESEKQKYAARAQAAEPAPEPVAEDRGNFGQQVLQGAAMNFGDEAMGGVASTYARIYENLAKSQAGDMLGISEGFKSGISMDQEGLTDDITYDTATESMRADLKDYAEKNPGTALAGQIMGALASGGLVGAKLMQLRALAPINNTVRMAAIAGSEGAVAGAGEGTDMESRIEGALTQGGQAAVLGPLMQKGGEQALKFLKRGDVSRYRESLTPTHTPETLKAAAGDLYSQADNAGLHIKEGVYTEFRDELLDFFKKRAVDGVTYPKLSKAIRRLKKLKDPTYADLDGVKTMLTGAKMSESMADRKFAAHLDKGINKFIGDLTPDKVISGDATGVARKLEIARDMWHRAEKGELIEKGVERAARSKKGRMGAYDESVTGQLASMANSSKKARALGPETVSDIDKIISGGRVKSIARDMAEVDPGSATARGGTPIAAGFVVDAITQDPKAGVVAALVTAIPLLTGTVGKKVANSITKSELKVLQSAINNEGQLTLKQVSERLVKKYASRTDAAALGIASGTPGDTWPLDQEYEKSPGGYDTSLQDMMP